LVSVPERVATTRELATGAPEASLTVPWMREVEVCADARAALSTRRIAKRGDMSPLI